MSASSDDGFLEKAEPAVATVILKLKQLKPSGMSYRLRYRFEGPDQTHEQESEVALDLFNRVETGDKLNIGFLPDDASTARILSLA